MSFKRVVLIPAGQALILGAFVGGAAMSSLRAAEREWFNSGIAIWLLVTSLIYWRLSLWNYAPVRIEPKQQRTFTDTIRTTILDETDTPFIKGKRLKLEVDRVKLIMLARDVCDGENVTYSNFSGRGKLYSRNEFENIRKQLLRGKILIPNNPIAPTQGVYVSRAGVAFFRYYATQKTVASSLIIPDYLQNPGLALQNKRARISTQEMIEL